MPKINSNISSWIAIVASIVGILAIILLTLKFLGVI